MTEDHIEHWTGERMIQEIHRLRAELEALDRSHKDLAHKLADAGREIDRLRHDIERMQEIDSEHLAEIERLRAELEEKNSVIRTMDGGIDRLRAENASLKSQNIRQETMVQDANNELHNLRAENEQLQGYAEGHDEAIKHLTKIISELRAENAEMKELLRICRIKARRGTAAAIDAILAKTAKENN